MITTAMGRVTSLQLEGFVGTYWFRREQIRRSKHQSRAIGSRMNRVARLCTSSKTNPSPLSHPSDPVVDKYLNQLRQGSRAALASAITLVETEHNLKKQLAKKILTRILQEESDNRQTATKQQNSSFRIGLSGPPGAGKSSFIEVFGKFLTSRGHKVAVLAVDPSSATTGGSLLGDKTRMVELTRDANAYIRPSPAKGHLGGVTRSTNEAVVICEYAGYDIILIETIGVGQSEYAVTNMVDLFVLLLPPGGGDELQGIKRGIIERADIILVTKADGDLLPAAHRTQYEYMAALKFMRSSTPKWKTKVQQISSKTKEGIEKFWGLVNEFRTVTADNFYLKRSGQRNTWFWAHIKEGLFNILLQDPTLKKTIESLSEQVEKGQLAPGVASDEILSMITSNLSSNKGKDK